MNTSTNQGASVATYAHVITEHRISLFAARSAYYDARYLLDLCNNGVTMKRRWAHYMNQCKKAKRDYRQAIRDLSCLLVAYQASQGKQLSQSAINWIGSK